MRNAEVYAELIALGAQSSRLRRSLYVLALMTSINCGVDVICLRPVEADASGQRAQTYPTEETCTAARDRFSGQHDATHHLNLRCVPENAAVPYDAQRSELNNEHGHVR